MEEIISEFITEADESLDRIEPLFVELEKRGEDTDLLNDIFRSMHTIKGAAGFLGFQPIVDVAHSSENIMKKLRDGEIPLSRDLMDAILRSIDMLRLLLGHLKARDGIEENVSPLVKELECALSSAMNGGQPPADQHTPAAVVSNDLLSAARAAEGDREDGSEDESGAAVMREEAAAHGDGPLVQESVMGGSQQAGSDPGDKDVAEKKQADHSRKLREKTAQNLRVDVERIDKVMDLAGEVVLVRNRLLNISNYFTQKYSHDLHTETLMETVSFLDRVTSDMQLAVMKMRMQPINKVLAKFPRLVRDMSATVNKDVELIIYGEGTEVDKSVIEHIGDPLTHILRNSIDHGLESPEERIAAGKSPKGKVIINTFQRGSQIVIEISDDGRGLDIEKLKRIAVEKGLLTHEDVKKMSDEAATDIIFMPGFSTKQVATELSGRGVGMDVVRNNISLLNGFVEINTEKNGGTTFRICIPLTLAIIQALMVEVSGSKYAIPLTPIEETLKVSHEDVNNVTGQSVIVIRDKVCPLFQLKNLLGQGMYETGTDPDHKYIVVIAMGDKRFCVAVDRLLGQEEVVIKTIDGIDTTMSNVLGATITGDGKVVFILDVTSMSRSLLGAAKN
ncbi:MAG: chemotaxis protein CheA [Nitrospiraceae bacterium]|nr:MAG: chemotaxis protein CheA [Nitrospiraceae bacterium]